MNGFHKVFLGVALILSSTANAADGDVWLARKIDELVVSGHLDPYAVYSTPDEAAMTVLRLVAPLAEAAGHEIGGQVFPERGGWSYTIPRVGLANAVFVPYGLPAYHTHPRRQILRFSNHDCAHDGGPGDVGWVEASGSPLYLGVISATGSVLVGVCDPGTCGHEGVAGTSPTRVLTAPTQTGDVTLAGGGG